MISEATLAQIRLVLLGAYNLPDGYFRPADTSTAIHGDAYAIVRLDSAEVVGNSVGVDATDTTLHNGAFIEFDLAIDFMGDGASDHAAALKLHLQRDDVTNQLDALGVGVNSVSTVRNLTALEADRVGRFNVIATFNYINTVIEQQACITSAEVSIASVELGNIDVGFVVNSERSPLWTYFKLWSAIAGNENKTFDDFILSIVQQQSAVQRDLVTIQAPAIPAGTSLTRSYPYANFIAGNSYMCIVTSQLQDGIIELSSTVRAGQITVVLQNESGNDQPAFDLTLLVKQI
jgi:hypothetical protein